MASDTFRVSRSADIAAPPDRVHGLVNDFHEWRSWSPWEDIDPEMRRDYSGPPSGIGAAYAWNGNRKAGRGRMEIVESTADHVGIDLVFSAPFPANNKIIITFTPAGAGTRVEWAMTGPLNLAMRLFTMIRPMDKLVGPDFEKGLRQLRQQAEHS